MKTRLWTFFLATFVSFGLCGRTHAGQDTPCIIYTCPVEMLSSTLNNGSFEQMLSGWSYNAGVYHIGHAGSQPIGVEGELSADLGGANIVGAKMWQSVAVRPGGQYELSFYSCANGSGYAGRTAVGRVEVEDAQGQIIAGMSFTNVSPTPMLGSNGFERHQLEFGVGSAASCVTIRFLDLTPGGGSSSVL